MAYDVKAMEQYIQQAAQARGIDPNIAVRVARSEGLGENIWQSNVVSRGRREPSYGPYQLLVGGNGFPMGMGNDFKKQTGLDPSDPKNVYATVDFALDNAARNGWGAWYGAKAAGIGNRDGIGGNASPKGLTLNSAPVVAAETPALPSSGSGAEAPETIQSMLAEAAGMSGNPVKDGIGLLAGAFGSGGGKNPTAEAHQVPIQSSLGAMEVADASRIAAAQQLLSGLLASKKKVPGLSLMG